MFKEIFYNNRNNTMYLWEQVNGENFFVEEKWVPYVFIKTKDDTDVRSIHGDNVIKKTFNSYSNYKNFQDENKSDIILENSVKPEIQFLAEKYHHVPDDEITPPKLRIRSIDIEVNHLRGFPNVLNPQDEITAITIMDDIDYTAMVFSCGEYTGDPQEKFRYFKCKDEKDLLIKFFRYFSKNPADILVGWNITGFQSTGRTQGFDLPYIINRCKYLFGEDTNIYRGFSPIGIVRTWIRDGIFNVDIAGMSVIDYMDIYKWYSPNKLESYSLDFVCKFELEKGKVDYSEYEDLRELYKEDFNKFINYNITDVKRVLQLERKLGYIKLIQSLSLLTKVPMKFYHMATALMEGLMLTYYRRNNLCAPRFYGGEQQNFEAAYVKEPQIGMHEWLIDLDIASSYPSHILTLNMSIETFFGRIINLNEDMIINSMRNEKFPEISIFRENLIKLSGTKLDRFNLAIKKGLFSVAPCGSIFTTKKEGVIASVQKYLFFKRQDIKSQMKEVRGKLLNLSGDDKRLAEEEANRLFSFQWSLKIVLNSFFGCTAVPYSRYFNTGIAEAITSCGRHTIKMGEKFANEILNNPNEKLMNILEKLGKTKNLTDVKDFVSYIDTDSLFLMLGQWISDNDSKIWSGLPKEEKIKYLKEISIIIEEYVNERIFNEVQRVDYNSQVEDFKISFEQEIILQSALFVAKKKYGYWCVDEGGVSLDKLKVTGLEIVRSDSPEIIRDGLREILSMILKNEKESKILDVINHYKKIIKKCYPEEIAANVGVNGIRKYINDDFTCKKGAPWHVKATANYKKLRKELNLVNKYEDIYDGTKIKVVYLKKNKFRIEAIAFLRWPKEFNDYLEVDISKMIEKFFVKKINTLLKPMNKENLLDSQNQIMGMFF